MIPINEKDIEKLNSSLINFKLVASFFLLLPLMKAFGGLELEGLGIHYFGLVAATAWWVKSPEKVIISILRSHKQN